MPRLGAFIVCLIDICWVQCEKARININCDSIRVIQSTSFYALRTRKIKHEDTMPQYFLESHVKRLKSSFSLSQSCGFKAFSHTKKKQLHAFGFINSIQHLQVNLSETFLSWSDNSVQLVFPCCVLFAQTPAERCLSPRSTRGSPEKFSNRSSVPIDISWNFAHSQKALTMLRGVCMRPLVRWKKRPWKFSTFLLLLLPSSSYLLLCKPRSLLMLLCLFNS